jgi:hypothetical protein
MEKQSITLPSSTAAQLGIEPVVSADAVEAGIVAGVSFSSHEEALALGNRIHKYVVAPEAVVDEPLVMLPQDEINIEAAEGTLQAVPLVGEPVVGQLYSYQTPTPSIADPEGLATPVTLSDKGLQLLKVLEDNPQIVESLGQQGLAIDYEAIQEVIDSPVACACTDCVEAAGVATDLELIVADMSERLAKLEERIALHNLKASHKI